MNPLIVHIGNEHNILQGTSQAVRPVELAGAAAGLAEHAEDLSIIIFIFYSRPGSWSIPNTYWVEPFVVMQSAQGVLSVRRTWIQIGQRWVIILPDVVRDSTGRSRRD